MTAVEGVTHQRYPGMLQVGADLVFPVGVRQALQQRDTGEALHDLELRPGLLPPLASLHDFRLAGHPADLGINLK